MSELPTVTDQELTQAGFLLGLAICHERGVALSHRKQDPNYAPTIIENVLHGVPKEWLWAAALIERDRKRSNDGDHPGGVVRA